MKRVKAEGRHIGSLYAGTPLETVEKSANIWLVPGISLVFIASELLAPRDAGDIRIALLLGSSVLWAWGVWSFSKNPDSFRAIVRFIDTVLWALLSMLGVMTWSVIADLPIKSLAWEWRWGYVLLGLLAIAYGVVATRSRWKLRSPRLAEFWSRQGVSGAALWAEYFRDPREKRGALRWLQPAVSAAVFGGMLIAKSEHFGSFMFAMSFLFTWLFPPVLVGSVMRRWYMVKAIGSADFRVFRSSGLLYRRAQ